MDQYHNYSNTGYGASQGRDPKVVSTGPVSLDTPEANTNSGTYYSEGRDQQRYGGQQSGYDQQSAGYQQQGVQGVQATTMYAVPVATTTVPTTTSHESYSAEPAHGHHQHGHHEKSDKPGLGERIKVAFGMTPEQKELKREHKEEMKAIRQEHKAENKELKQELSEEQRREAQMRHQEHGYTGNQGYNTTSTQGVQQGYVPAQQFNVVELRPADRTNY